MFMYLFRCIAECIVTFYNECTLDIIINCVSIVKFMHVRICLLVQCSHVCLFQ